MTHLKLEAAFPAADRSDWETVVAKIIGAEAARGLSTATRDGITVEPIYPQRQSGHSIPGIERGWRVFQRADHPDPAEANRMALADLASGADGIELVLPGSCVANGFGVGIETLDDLDRLFADIDLEQTPIRIDGGYEMRSATAFMAALVERRGCDPGRIDVVGQSDPANGLFAEGRLTAPYETICDWGADIVHGLLARGLDISLFIADGRAVHSGGGSEAQELAYVVADGVQHLRMLERRGVALEDAARQIAFTLAADADQFMTAAKFRAFRLLWARITEVVGLPGSRPRLNGETAWRMMARRDPWTNILRSTVAVAGAALGGADTIVVLPFTTALGLPDASARRLARNTQLVLLHEAGLAEVADPGAGSGYVESLTEELAERAWELFQEIEREGGLVASLRKGSFQAKVLETRSKMLRDVATRREPILGVSEFAWLAEPAVRMLDCEPAVVRESGRPLIIPPPGRGQRFERLVDYAGNGASLADMHASTGKDWERSEQVPKLRLAESFERLRDAADRHLELTGERPRVFLANLGAPADHAPQSQWARRVFAAGGIEAESDTSFDGLEALLAAFRSSGSQMACICGSDADYAELAVEVAGALRRAGARTIYVAGRPGALRDRLAEAGIEAYLHQGCDIVAFLQSVQMKLGIVQDEAAKR